MSDKLTPEQIEALQKENESLKQANTALTTANTELTATNSELQQAAKTAGKKTGKKLSEEELAELQKSIHTVLASGESHTTKTEQILELLGIGA